MANYNEPTHDMNARDTSISKLEGRLREGVALKRKRKKKLKKIINKYGKK